MILNCNTNHRRYKRKYITQAAVSSNRYRPHSNVQIEENNTLIMYGIVCAYLTDVGIDYTFQRHAGVWLMRTVLD